MNRSQELLKILGKVEIAEAMKMGKVKDSGIFTDGEVEFFKSTLNAKEQDLVYITDEDADEKEFKVAKSKLTKKVKDTSGDSEGEWKTDGKSMVNIGVPVEVLIKKK